MKINPELVALAAGLMQDVLRQHPHQVQSHQELGALFARAYEQLEQARQQLARPAGHPPVVALNVKGL